MTFVTVLLTLVADIALLMMHLTVPEITDAPTRALVGLYLLTNAAMLMPIWARLGIPSD